MAKRRKKGIDIHGWVVLDKDLGRTSTDAVYRIKRLFNANKCGHAGTLDPLASGVLPIALGEATRTVPWLMEAQKTYEFTVKWGSSTTTQDAEGEIVATSLVRPSDDEINSIIPNFLGEIEQIPPKYSAIKIDGERAYDLAREGEDFELSARIVKTHDLKLISNSSESASFFVRSGKGFYVRALARDMAKALGTEGHIIKLRRTSVGPFKEESAKTLETLENSCIGGEQILLPFETALGDIPVLAIKEDEVFDLRQGRQILVLPHKMAQLKELFRPREIASQDMTRAVLATFNDEPIALGIVRAGKFAPFRVFQI